MSDSESPRDLPTDHPGIEDEYTPRPPSYESEEAQSIGRPREWMYKAPRIGGLRLPWFASPPTQLVLVGLVCFLCPGMYNALTGLGGAGQLDPNDNNLALVALYSTFAVVGFFAGTFANRLGIRLTLALGGLGYSIYAGALLCYNHTKNAPFLIASGSILGICAGLLWCAQGAIMMSYPPERSKGRYISWFWMIFNLGAVIGSLVRRLDSRPELY
jgi:MFS family permease